MRNTLSRLAVQDIETLIESSLLQFGMEQTERYQQDLDWCLSLLATEPEIGVSIDEVRAGYRKFPYDSHVIYCKVRIKRRFYRADLA